MEDAYQYHEVNSEQPEQSQNNDEPPKKKSTYDDFNATLDGESSPVSSENMKEK